MSIINRPYTPTGNRIVVHNNIENRVTENYYRDWYDLCVRSQPRKAGWYLKRYVYHHPFSHSVEGHSKQ